MNETSAMTASVATPRIRPMSHDELLPLLKCSNPRNLDIDFAGDVLVTSCLRERIGWVAEVQGHLAGAAVGVVVWPETSTPKHTPLQRLTGFLDRILGYRDTLPLYVELLKIVVLDPARPVVEAALLGSLVEEMRHSWGLVPVVVRESHVAAQLFLRETHYRAVRVLRGYYGQEDGYVMSPNQGCGH
jgi:hypothetical protein